MDKAELLYNYPLYSIKRIPTFLKYAWEHSLLISNKLVGGGNRFAIFLDMIWCNLSYGAMDSRDYLLFDFYNKSSKERDAYLTKRRYFKLIKTFDYETFSRLIVKGNAYKDYADYISRNWKIIDAGTSVSEIKEMIDIYGTLLVKPNTGEQGHGIFKVSNDNLQILLDNLKGDTSYILEEIVENSSEIKQINHSSLNTFRIYTFLDKKSTPHILGIMLRVGLSGSTVDNWGSGGIGYSFDIETGICDGPGYDKKHNKYLFHPGSNFKMIGFEIPRFERLKEFVYSLATINPNAIYVGWDIADTPNGYELIEMNFPGGHDFLQAFGSPKYKEIKSYLND